MNQTDPIKLRTVHAAPSSYVSVGWSLDADHSTAAYTTSFVMSWQTVCVHAISPCNWKWEEQNDKKRADIIASNIVDQNNMHATRMMIDCTHVLTFEKTTSTQPDGLPNTKLQVQRAHKAKVSRYKELAKQQRMQIVPALMTEYGALGLELNKLLKKAKERALYRGIYNPPLDQDSAVHWKENMVCSTHRVMAQQAVSLRGKSTARW